MTAPRRTPTRRRKPRTTTPEQRKRTSDRKRRARNRKGMDKLDTMYANGYRLAIANDPCYYCGKRDLLMHTDHFWALARGGTSHWYNLVRACASCNIAKKAKCGLCWQGKKCRSRCRPKAATPEFPNCVAVRVILAGPS